MRRGLVLLSFTSALPAASDGFVRIQGVAFRTTR